MFNDEHFSELISDTNGANGRSEAGMLRIGRGGYALMGDKSARYP